MTPRSRVRPRRGTSSLTEASVLVTGAGSGIGRATALAFSRRGSSVLVTDLDLQAADKVAAECAETGGRAQAHRLDVTDAGAVEELAARVEHEHGPIDVLVNNAGVGMSGPLEAMSLDDWVWIRTVNLDGVVTCTHAFGRRMLERGSGHVVNVSSGLAFVASPRALAYGTTKAAVLMFSQALRAGWAPQGVKVSVVCPGVIDTPIIERTRFVGEQSQAERPRVERIFRRGHSPAKVARAVVRSVERDRTMTTVGVEAKLAWAAHRLLPLSAAQQLARLAR